MTSKAYRVYNKRTLVVEENFHVAFDEAIRFCSLHAHYDEDAIVDVLKSNPTPIIENKNDVPKWLTKRLDNAFKGPKSR